MAEETVDDALATMQADFDAALKDDLPPVGGNPHVEQPEGDAPADPPADPPAEEDPPADPPAEEDPPADPPAEEDPPADPPKAKTPEPTPLDPDVFATAVADKLKPAPAKPEEPDVLGQARSLVENPESVLEDDERATLKKFGEDWADVQGAIAVREKVQSTRMAGVLVQMNAALQGQITALQNRIDEMTGTLSTTAMHSQFPDYGALREKVSEWVGKQPELYRPALQEALDSKDAGKFAQLVEAYNAANPAPAAEDPPAAPATTERPSNVAHMTPVKKRGTSPLPASEPDQNDAEAAFKEALKVVAS